jgi:hypothetical protein
LLPCAWATSPIPGEALPSSNVAASAHQLHLEQWLLRPLSIVVRVASRAPWEMLHSSRGEVVRGGGSCGHCFGILGGSLQRLARECTHSQYMGATWLLSPQGAPNAPVLLLVLLAGRHL